MKCSKSDIPWCDYGASPVTGCLHPCRGKFCYAASMVKRYGAPDVEGLHVLDEPVRDTDYDEAGNVTNVEPAQPYPFGFAPTYHRYRLDAKAPRKPGRVFVVPMGDLWGAWVPSTWQDEVLGACAQDQRHDWLFLTKHPIAYRRVDWYDKPWAWLGATATTADMVRDHSITLFAASKGVTFISMEPWLGGEAGLNHVTAGVSAGLLGSAWLILGPLNGAKAHTAPHVSRDAVLRLRDACHREGVALFVKPDATKWGLSSAEVAGMQAFPKPHPSERTADDFQALPFEAAVAERNQASLL